MTKPRLRWNKLHSACGQYHIQTEHVRGEPVLYVLEGLTPESQRIIRLSCLECAFYGRGGIAKCKMAAQDIEAYQGEIDAMVDHIIRGKRI